MEPAAEQMLEVAWRTRPHTFMHHITEGRFKMHRWVQHLGDYIGRAIVQGGARIIVNVHPRIGKSELTSYALPTWFLETWPDKRVMMLSHDDNLSVDFGRRVRNEFASNGHLTTKLRQDSTAAGRWNTDKNGGMYCAGVGGSITGRGFNLGIIDDPIKNWQDATSAEKQLKLREWFGPVFATRAEPGASMLIVMHRWTEDDLAGWLISESEDNWTVIRLPALAEADDEIGRFEGEALCPERFDEDALKVTRRTVGKEAWISMYQQDPASARSDRIYSHYSELNLDGSLQLLPGMPLQLSVDFNIDPGMHMVVGQQDEKNDLFSAVYEIHGPRMNVEQAVNVFIDLIKSEIGGWPFPELQIFGDATGQAELVTTSESTYQFLLRHLRKRIPIDLRRRVPKAQPPVIDRIMAMNDALRDVDDEIHYLVHPRCKLLIRDFKKLKPASDGLIDKTNQKLSHASDAEGYRIHYLRPLGAQLMIEQ